MVLQSFHRMVLCLSSRTNWRLLETNVNVSNTEIRNATVFSLAAHSPQNPSSSSSSADSSPSPCKVLSRAGRTCEAIEQSCLRALSTSAVRALAWIVFRRLRFLGVPHTDGHAQGLLFLPAPRVGCLDFVTLLFFNPGDPFS